MLKLNGVSTLAERPQPEQQNLLPETELCVCKNETCSRYNVLVEDPKQVHCLECKGDLFPIEDDDEIIEYEDLIEGDVPGDLPTQVEFSSDMLERMSAQAFTNVQSQSPKPQVVHGSDTFSCPADLSGCPIASRPRVYVPIDLFNKWIYLACQIKTEWIAYLKGHERDGNPDHIEITGMYFPRQRATGAHCEAQDGEIQEGTVAAVHSHVGMGVFFSAEDVAHFNHKIELVVNNKGEIKANGRTKLECGRFHRGDAEIFFIGCEEEISLQEQLESVLVEETWRSYPQQNHNGNRRQNRRAS